MNRVKAAFQSVVSDLARSDRKTRNIIATIWFVFILIGFFIVDDHPVLGSSAGAAGSAIGFMTAVYSKDILRWRKARTIERVPGFFAYRLLGHVTSSKFRERELEGVLAECIAEFQECIAVGDLTRARILRVMIPVRLIATVSGGFGGWLVRQLAGRMLK